MELEKTLHDVSNRIKSKFANKRDLLTMYLNGTYLILCPLFIYFEKVGSGQYVPHILLGWVYAVVWVTNFLCFCWYFTRRRNFNWFRNQTVNEFFRNERLRIVFTYGSLFSLMFMSFLNMTGFGNPSNDSILTDFAFGHSLIIIATVITTRKIAAVWFVFVVFALVYISFKIGYNYQYNYLTTKESANYEMAIKANKTWALERQAQLKSEGLNPPHVSRYTNVWLVFLFQALIISLNFNGITSKIIDETPHLQDEISKAILMAHNEELEKIKLEKELSKSELNFLKSQFNSHFLFNCLNYIYSKSNNIDKNLSEMVMLLSKIMRYMLNEGEINQVHLESEISCIKDYIKIFELRTNRKLPINFVVTGNIQNVAVYPLIFMGFIENIFKHGVYQIDEYPVNINLQIADKLIFDCRNKIEKDSIQESTGIGNKNIKKRLEIIYPNQHQIDIRNDGEYFVVHLEIEYIIT